jgi:hypothetical protein
MTTLALSPTDATYVRSAALRGRLDEQAALALRAVLPPALATPCDVDQRYYGRFEFVLGDLLVKISSDDRVRVTRPLLRAGLAPYGVGAGAMSS